jgi:hypothetical protein
VVVTAPSIKAHAADHTRRRRPIGSGCRMARSPRVPVSREPAVLLGGAPRSLGGLARLQQGLDPGDVRIRQGLWGGGWGRGGGWGGVGGGGACPKLMIAWPAATATHEGDRGRSPPGQASGSDREVGEAEANVTRLPSPATRLHPSYPTATRLPLRTWSRRGPAGGAAAVALSGSGGLLAAAERRFGPPPCSPGAPPCCRGSSCSDAAGVADHRGGEWRGPRIGPPLACPRPGPGARRPAPSWDARTSVAPPAPTCRGRFT